jgi:uncharacterized protein (TIGR03435 family)
MTSAILRRIRPILAAAGLGLALAGLLLCQQPASGRAQFAVTSVKLERNCEPLTGNSLSPVSLRLACAPLRTLIRMAYSEVSAASLALRKLSVEGGPRWLDSDRYTISAKTERPSTADQMLGPMLRSLLEDRFQLKVRTGARDGAVYFLTIAEGGTNLQAIHDGDCRPIDLFRDWKRPAAQVGQGEESAQRSCGDERGHPTADDEAEVFDLYGFSMKELASRFLPRWVDRPVVDNTRLEGRFAIHLTFSTKLARREVRLNGVEMPSTADDTVQVSDRSIFNALRKQLGLKLTPGTSPLDVLVIDHVERPSAD